MIVGLDPGHGGSDRGCALVSGYGSMSEAEYTLLVAQRLKGVLPGAVLTRETDTAISLGSRAMLAVANKTELVISLHVDSRPGALRGLSCWHLPGNVKMMTLAHRIYDLAPSALRLPPGPGRARPIVSAINEDHLPRERRWRHRGRHVLISFPCDTLLIEMGDCVGDIEALLRLDVQEGICQAAVLTLKEEGYI